MNREIREKLKSFIKVTGTTQQFIATSVGLSKVSINLFLKAERNLKELYLLRIDNLINDIKEELNNIC